MEWFAWCAGTINPTLRHMLASIIRVAISKRLPRAEKLAVLIEGDDSIPHPYALARMLFMPRQLRQLSLVSEGRDVNPAKAPLADIAEVGREI